MISYHPHHFSHSLLIGLIIVLGCAADALALRDNELASPSPLGNSNIFLQDNSPSITGIPKLDIPSGDFPVGAVQDKHRTGETAGGEDIIVDSNYDFGDSDMGIAENGDIFVAVEAHDYFSGNQIRVYRSQDGGGSFTYWGRLYNNSVYENYSSPSLEICEGQEDRLFIAYRRNNSSTSEIHVSYAPLDGETADWSDEITALSGSGTQFRNPDLCSDNVSFSSYYLYLVAEGSDTTGQDIWYTRSMDFGATWDSGYEIGTLSYNDRYYAAPDISYGFGGIVHVVWEFGIFDESYDTALRYRHCTNYGSGGIGNWSSIGALSSISNGISEMLPQVVASPSSLEVVIACERQQWNDSGYFDLLEGGTLFSTNQGYNFSDPVAVAGMLANPTEMKLQPDTNLLTLVGVQDQDIVMQQTGITTPLDWSTEQVFNDENLPEDSFHSFAFAFHGGHENRVATAWSPMNESTLVFDGQWRGDQGYPITKDGFPVELLHEPISDPALVDLDGDGYQEIVFSDNGHQICVFRADGSPAQGWPVDAGEELSSGPVAVGDLVGLGQKCVVAGTENGSVLCYDATGHLLPGFPRVVNPGHSAQVSLGNLGGLLLNTIVVGCGADLVFLNDQGQDVAGSHGYSFPSSEILFPAAIGDIDNDATNEVVFAGGSYVVAKRMFESSISLMVGVTGGDVSNSPTIGDLDLDGDLEIAVPTVAGKMYVFQHDGYFVPGFPVTTASESPLSQVAWANILGPHEPELAFNARSYTVELYAKYSEYGPVIGFPVHPTSGWYLLGSPVMGLIEGASGDVIVGSRDQNIWSWNNYGALIPGWPRPVGGVVEHTPALGDLDSDGSADIVFLSQDQLLAFDIHNQVDEAEFTWNMYGNDPRRTGCYNCPEEEPGLSGQPDPAVTRVSFAAPAPNPTSASTLFCFEQPGPAQVSLEVYNIRGLRVRSIVKEEMTAGHHTVFWNGQDKAGRKLPSGTYFARLRVRGPGFEQALTRKISLVQ